MPRGSILSAKHQRRGTALAAISLASFVFCVWLTARSPFRAFYETPARVWDFGAGGVPVFRARAAAREASTALVVDGRNWAHRADDDQDMANALHGRTPDDVMTFGYIAEADIALGN